MNDAVLDSFRHNAWATRQLLAFCGQLSDDQLRQPAIGTYGSILETLNHYIEADAYYLWFLSNDRLSWDWKLDGSASIAQLATSAEAIAAGWERFLTLPFDPDLQISRPSVSEGSREERAGTLLAQAIHHPNVHREQVNMMLTTMGLQPPDLDVWVYDWVVLKGNSLP
jgi:uncharacterized damage-inducible protein DinB